MFRLRFKKFVPEFVRCLNCGYESLRWYRGRCSKCNGLVKVLGVVNDE